MFVLILISFFFVDTQNESEFASEFARTVETAESEYHNALSKLVMDINTIVYSPLILIMTIMSCPVTSMKKVYKG